MVGNSYDDLLEGYFMSSGNNRLHNNNGETSNKSSRIIEDDLPTDLDLDITEIDDDLAVINTLEDVGDYFDIYRTGGIKKVRF